MKRLLLIILVAGVIIWLVNPQILTDASSGLLNNLSNRVNKKSKSVLGVAVLKVDKYVNKKTKEVLGDAINISLIKKPVAEVIDNVPNEELDNIILIDYLTNKDLEIKLELDKAYYLDLRNIPENLCLFINNKKYQPKKNQYLSISFNSVGSYDLHFEECLQPNTKFGEIIVQ